MIDWSAFLLVAVASLIGAILVILFASLGFRLFDSEAKGARAIAWGCFTVCAAAVLFGIYLIVPAFHH